MSLVVPLAYFTSLPASTESSCPLQPFMAQNIEGVGHHGNGQELWTRISHFFPHHKCQITMISNTVTVALVLDLVHLDPPVHAVLPPVDPYCGTKTTNLRLSPGQDTREAGDTHQCTGGMRWYNKFRYKNYAQKINLICK